MPLDDPGPRLLPAALDPLARRFAPPWPDRALDAGRATGSGSRLLRPLLWLLVAAAAAQSVLHVVDVVAFHLSVTSIDADADHSIDGWLGTVTTALTAWGALLLALLVPRGRPVRTGLLVLAALCAYLSLDDMLALHEMVARLALRHPVYGHSGYDLWPAVYLPMLSVVGWLMLRTARSIDVVAGRRMVLGLSALVVAVLLETLAPVLFALGSGHGHPAYETEVVVEEALELLGWGLMAVGLTGAVVDLVLHTAPRLAPAAQAADAGADLARTGG